MGVRILDRVDGGAYGDLYRGRDALERDVAVKLMRPSVGDEAFALKQAQALARAQHPNVVTVFGVEEVTDPVTNNQVRAIIMEFLSGQTPRKLLAGPPLPVGEVRRIGDGMLDGLQYIHAQGLAHGDLHSENIMIGIGRVKIIDILYYDSLAQVSTQSLETRQQSDIAALRSLLHDLLSHAELEPSNAARFLASIDRNASLPTIRAAFHDTIPAGNQIANRTLVGSPDVSTTLKEYLVHDRYRIKLHDLIMGEVERVAAAIESPEFGIAAPVPSAESISSRVRRYEELCDALARMFAIGCWWGEERHRYLWKKGIQRLASYILPGGQSYPVWTSMKRYPSLILLYAGGIASVAAERWENQLALVSAEVTDNSGDIAPAAEVLFPTSVIGREAGQLLPGLERHKTPVSDRLFSALRDPLRGSLVDEKEYEDAFDRYEYAQAILTYDILQERGASRLAPMGRFSWKWRDAPTIAAGKRFARDAAEPGAEAMLQAGLFSGSKVRLSAAKFAVEKQVTERPIW